MKSREIEIEFEFFFLGGGGDLMGFFFEILPENTFMLGILTDKSTLPESTSLLILQMAWLDSMPVESTFNIITKTRLF